MIDYEKFVDSVSLHRKTIKRAALEVKDSADQIKQWNNWPTESDKEEVVANFMITYRHLEDAAMRLGKVIQAYDGGISIYDK